MTPNQTYPAAYQHFMARHPQQNLAADNRVAQLEAEVASLKERLEVAVTALENRSSSASTAATPRVTTSKTLKVNKPTVFNGGGTTKFREWMDGLTIYLDASGIKDNHDRIVLALSYLHGSAADAVRLYHNKLRKGESLGSWNDFYAKLAAVYGIHDEAGNARVQLDKLEQGDKSVAEYSAKFEELVAFLDGLPDSERIFQYRKGLNFSVAKVIASKEADHNVARHGVLFPKLEDLIAFCKRHDDSMAALRLTHPPKPKSSTSTSSHARSHVTTSAPATTTYVSAPTSMPTPARDPNAMDISAARPDTRKCFNCDKIGHLSRNCPLPRKPRPVQVKASNVDTEEMEHRQALMRDAEENVRKELEVEMTKKFEERMAAMSKQMGF